MAWSMKGCKTEVIERKMVGLRQGWYLQLQ